MPDLLQRRYQLIQRDHGATGRQATAAFVRDRLFEIGEDLGPVGVALQARAGIGEPTFEPGVGVLLELEGVAVQAGGDDTFHEGVSMDRPRPARVRLMRVQ